MTICAHDLLRSWTAKRGLKTVSEQHYCCPSNIPTKPPPRLGFAIRRYGCRANTY
ncbi:hypothetical protein PGT21_034157 [Puccinia graminis f. sp. tritici]|uniref:Uncharacterized protein n=1 Tax=Puccinia graminis f. sp. tritici TaxID=56615 RepID=A0A5B0PMJ3_PUCGR|nr:hypothetical protein PGT21_034157 [Puccinia graminis f. sp. tritici]